MKKVNKVLAILLASIMVLSITQFNSAYAENTEEIYYFDEAAHNSQFKPTNPQSLEDINSFDDSAGFSAFAAAENISLFSSYVPGTGSMIGNSYLEFYVGRGMGDSVNNGRFTIGNTGGNPNSTSDNNKILMFGHPSPWSSYTTIRINNTDYIFNSNNTTYDTTNLRAVSTMTVDGVLVTQTLQIVNNASTGLKDTVQISYSARNTTTSAKNIGIRIMMDTMLGDNDGAPFKVPSLGNVTYERELSGSSIPQSWQAFDRLTNPSVFAVGTLYKTGDVRPDKIQFVDWTDIYGSSNKWNYTINTSRLVTGDSAVAIYWNPKSVAAGATTTVSTYYGVGLSSTGGGSVVGETSNVPSNEYWVQVLNSYTRAAISGATVTIDGVTRTTDSSGIAKFTNPVETSRTVSVTASGYNSGLQSNHLKTIKRGTQTTILLTSSGEVNVSSVTVDGRNVLSATQTFTKPGTTNSINVSVDWAGRAPGSYQLVQNNVVKHTSTSNNFSFNVSSLTSGADVYLRLVSSSTVVKTIKLGIVIRNAAPLSKSGSFTYPSTLTGNEAQYSYTYNDSWFLQSNTEYNHALSKMSLSFAMAAFQSSGSDPAKNIKNLYTQLGLSYTSASIKYPSPTTDSIGYAIGSKTFAVNNEEINLVVVAIRGGGYGREWASNFTVGITDEHAGFAQAANEVVTGVRNYLNTNGIKKNVKILITGYSRAGATANIAAERLTRATNITGLSSSGVYSYSFECPQTTYNTGSGALNNIFSIVNPIDPVTKVAPSSSGWGFKRYGITLAIPSAETTTNYSAIKQRMKNEYIEIAKSAGLSSSNATTKVNDVTKEMSGQGNFASSLIDNFASFFGGSFITGNSNGAKSYHYANAYQHTFRQIGTKMGASAGAFNIFGELMKGIQTDAFAFTLAHPINFTKAVANSSELGNAHYPELCLAWLNVLSGRSDFVSTANRRFSINCPVDVFVYDNDNNLVASIVDHVVTHYVEDVIGVYVDENDQIVIILPMDGEYRIEVIATDDGTVDYSISEYDDEAGKHVRVVNYYDVPISNGDMLTGTTLFGSNNYSLTSGSALIVSSVDLADSSVEYYTITTISDGNGYTYGAGQVLIGEYITLTATPNDFDTFIGWFDTGDMLLSDEQEYRFRVENNSTVKAKFTGVLVIPQFYDITLYDIEYDERQAVDGILDIELLLINAGTIDISSVDVSVAGSTLGGVFNETIPCTLLSENIAKLSITVDVPKLASLENYLISIVPTGGINNGSNNTATFVLGEYNLAISSNEYLEQGVFMSDVTVKNFGSKTDAVLRIIADDTDGAVLLEQGFGEMIMGENQSLTLDLDSLVAGMNITTLYAAVYSPSATEPISDNNIIRLDYEGNYVPSFNLNIIAGTGGTVVETAIGEYHAGEEINISAIANTGHEFVNWTSSVGGSFTSANSSDTIFTMPENDVTLTANFRVADGGGGNNGGGSGSSGGGSSYTPASTNIKEATFDKSAPKDIVVTLSTGSYSFRELKNGDYTLVRDKDYTVNGNTYTIKAEYLATLSAGKVTLVFNMSGGTNPTLVITIESGTQTNTGGTDTPASNAVMINGEKTNLTLNTDGSVTVTADDIAGLSTPIILSIPFNGVSNSHTGVVKKNGQNIIIPYSRSGSMIMLITEPGTYGVIENKKMFTDTSGHWAVGTIDFITAREIYSGIGDNKFDPNGSMTRAMFAQVLANIEKADLTAYKTSRFTDVEDGVWYTAAVEWAADKGIVGGYGGGLFGPNDLITREQMAVMLNNYMRHKGIVLKKEDDYIPFADDNNVSSWAKEAVVDMKRYGLIAGVGENRYAPSDTANRASVAQIFKNFIEAYIK